MGSDPMRTEARHALRGQTPSGFTLLELTITAALIVMMVAAVLTLVMRGLTAAQRSEASTDRIFLMEKALERLAADLRNGVALADFPFEGSQEEVRFAAAEDPTHLVQVRYRVSSEQAPLELFREWSSFPSAPGEPPQTKALISGIRSFSFEYGALGDVGQGRPPEFSWLSAWRQAEGPPKFPKLVKIRIEVQDPRGESASVTREIWIPHGALGELLPRE